MGQWNSYPFALEIMEGGLDYGKRKCDNYCRLGSARLGSARQEHSAVFSACQVLFHTIYNEPVAGDRVHYALASAFCVCRRKKIADRIILEE